jgi:hypothetical protein
MRAKPKVRVAGIRRGREEYDDDVEAALTADSGSRLTWRVPGMLVPMYRLD